MDMPEIPEAAYFDFAVSHKLYSGEPNLRFHLDYFFGGLSMANKNVLDVGGGSGLLSFYAGIKGAAKVVCLEPEFDGSSSGMNTDFNSFKAAFSGNMPVELQPLPLQEFLQQCAGETYDIVLLHNSINHLDENACINLHKDPSAHAVYLEIFTGVYRIMKPGGMLIIADCSSRNFYQAIGVKNVFVPTIEWHKHQPPQVWIRLLKEVGFKNPKLRWSTPNSLGKAGRIMMGNAAAAYFTSSHFKFAMSK